MANDHLSGVKNNLMTNDTMTKKKYILKPGKHQFAPKSPPVHNNEKLTDEEAEWYLERYPHIRQLFVDGPGVRKPECPEVKPSVESLKESVQSENNEDLLTTN
jgi:hypothetical protein